MDAITVTPIYAVPMAILFTWLSVRVISGRRDVGASIGDGDDKNLARRIRAQANCAEYAPLGLLLLLIAELQGSGVIWLHLGGLLLLAGRVLHGVGMTYPYGRFMTRVPGMALTFGAYIYAVLLILCALIW